MRLRVKAQDAAAEQARQQLIAPGTDAESFRVGPRDVPEGQHDGPGKPFADHAGEQREVVILDQDDRIDRLDLLAHGLGKLLIDRLVVIPVLDPELGPRVSHVTKRPETLVGEPVVVPAFLLRRQPEAANHVGLLAGRNPYVTALVDDLSVSRPAAMGNPDARAGAHDGLERGHQSACGMQDGKAPVALVLVDVRFPVGDDHDALAMEIPAQRVLEALRGPESARALRLPFGRQPIDQFTHVVKKRHEFRMGRLTPQQALQFGVPPAPRQPGRDQRRGRCGQRQDAEREKQKPARRVVPALDEAQVVHEHDESERARVAGDPNRRDVYVSAGQRHHRGPRRRIGSL